jgi:TonB family protein
MNGDIDTSSFTTVKWLVFLAFSLSVNLWLAMISEVEFLAAAPVTASSTLAMKFISPLSVSRHAAYHSVDTAVNTSQESAPPIISTQVPVQAVGGKSVQQKPKNNRAEVDKNVLLIEKNKREVSPKKSVAIHQSQQDKRVLLAQRNEQEYQLKKHIQNVSPTPAYQPHVEQQRMAQLKGSVENVEKVSLLDEGLTDKNARLKGAGGLLGDEKATKYTKAQYLRRDPPQYPERARTLGQQGTVVLHAEILPNGYSQHLKIAVSSGHQLLDGAAIAAVKRWQFVPAYEQGYPVAHWVSVPVRFTLQ